MKRKAVSQKVNEEEEKKKKRHESTETFAEKAEMPCVGESTKSSESPDEERSAGNFEEQTGVPDEDGSAERFEGKIEVPGEQGSFAEIMEEKARVSVGMGSTEACGLPNEAKSTESLEEEVRFPARFILDNMSCMQEGGPREVFETDCTASKHAESALDKKISCEDAQSNYMEVKCLSSDLVATTPQPLLGHNAKGAMSTCGSVMESFRVGSDRDCAAQDQTVESSGLESKERTESEDEDEDDIDFNPFLLHSPSPEASSGLSSESEDLEEENEMAVGHILKEHEGVGFLEAERKTCVELGSEEENEEVDDSEAEEDDNNDEDHADKSASEDRTFQSSIHAEHRFGVEHCFGVSTEPFEVSSASQRDCCAATVSLDGGYEEEDRETRCNCTLEQSSGDFAALSNLNSSSRNEELGMETAMDESAKEEEQAMDAICRRTRAHYSLTDMSLDELETFLQESDEEDYFQNVDDEEEYRKFVAAVQGSWNEGTCVDNQDGSRQGEEAEDEDEDEEDDYDFEIELEEALESDYEETCKEEVWKRKRRAVMGHRLEKRKHRERPLGSAKTPLRPLLPSIVCKDAASDAYKFSKERLYKGKPGTYGFTACQRGQLQCLVHEHVQLLVQVFSLTVLDPSRQQIAIDSHRLLVQLAETREQVLLWKKSPFPEVCFCPGYVHASTSSNLQPPGNVKAHLDTSNQSISRHLLQKEASCHASRSSMMSVNDAHRSSCSSVDLHTNVIDGDIGLPSIAGGYTETNQQKFTQASTNSGPVRSLLDVAPLALVKDFLTDVAKAVEVFRQQHVQSVSDCREFVRKPLFPMPMIQDYQVSPPEPSHRKKTMAAALVQDTKSNGIALVPLEISVAVSRFTALFNMDMFPHKPPPAALAKRLLFSEAEDELLAMGLMTYNTNWEKIQQHFLPSKTTHQIFVRQKNRSTARAPENSIKAVRRLKTSPLTKEEQSCIEEGLKVFKSDWTKVWEHCVPYRDPTTLPRLWRAAIGVQKSYSATGEAKEKHRIAEKMRRKKKAFSTAQDDGDNGEVNSGDEACGGATGVYLHEAFLTDWNPHACHSSTPAALPVADTSCGFSSFKLGNCSTTACQTHDAMQNNMRSSCMTNHLGSGAISLPVLGSSPLPTSGTFRNTTSSTSKRRHKGSWTCEPPRKGLQTIKLAPGLPSLNLPPCVRVISQAKFNNHSSAGISTSHVFLQNRSSRSQKGSLAGSSNGSTCASMPLVLPAPAVLAGSSQLPGSHGGNILSENHMESINKPSWAKMHPFLMQATYESGLPSLPISNKIDSRCKAFAGQPLSQNIPRFHPFFPASKGKIVLNSRQVLAASKESSPSGAAELHPFLQEEGEHQAGFLNTVRATVDPRSSIFKCSRAVTSRNNLGREHTEWPSVLSDSVIRPEPRRAVQLHDKQGELSAAVHNQKSFSVSAPVPNRKGGRKARSKKTLGHADQLGSRKQREKGNTDLVDSGEEENIVMEQEELSDSEEETDEDVQFEYEEMGDSDRDGSDHEKHASDLDKADEGIEFEEEEIGSDDSDNEGGM